MHYHFTFKARHDSTMRPIPLPPGETLITIRPANTPEARASRRARVATATCHRGYVCSGDGICACTADTMTVGTVED
jgi:hypothetical protein